jgi:tRNA(adenine34) deaminase
VDANTPAAYAERMRELIADAELAAAHADVPVSAMVLAADGAVIGRGRNQRELRQDPTAHAEILALRAAADATGDWHLDGTTLIVTLEPCVMCAGAILAARVPVVVFGAWDAKAGASGSVHDLLRDRRLPNRAEVFAGVEADACAAQLTAFFEGVRGDVSRDRG